MKSLILSIFFCIITCFVANANPAELASEFYANDQLIEATLQVAPTQLQLTNLDVSNQAESGFLSEQFSKQIGSKLAPKGESQIGAIILCFFFGGIAIHRVYLGSTGAMVVFYILTCFGICGLVPIIDFFILIFGGVDSFIDSDKFFSW